MNRKLILLVEDIKQVQNYNKSMLTDEGFNIETAMTLAEARDFLARQSPDAIILDRGMPDGEGLDLLRELREKGSKIPVLLLTGYGQNKDIVQGFKSGCSDYLTKPYTFDILLVRLLRLLQSAEQVPETVSRGLLTLNLISREAFIDGENLMLAPKHFALLQFFIQNENRVMAPDYIYERVWGQPMAENSKALNTVVSRLRKRLTGCGYTISMEYGNGYCFEPVSKKL